MNESRGGSPPIKKGQGPIKNNNIPPNRPVGQPKHSKKEACLGGEGVGGEEVEEGLERRKEGIEGGEGVKVVKEGGRGPDIDDEKIVDHQTHFVVVKMHFLLSKFIKSHRHQNGHFHSVIDVHVLWTFSSKVGS